MARFGSMTLPLLGDLLAFRADRLGMLTRQARDQGDVATFRIGPYRVWQLSHPDLVQDVLVSNAARFRKGPVLQRAKLVLGEGLLTAEGSAHRQPRRLLQTAFHPQRVESYAETMIDNTAAVVGRWRPDQPLDVHRATVRITLASAGAALLGTRVQDDVRLIEEAIDDLLSAYKLAFVPFGWRLQRLPVGPARRLRRGRKTLQGLIDRMIAERRTSGRDTGDALSLLVLGAGDVRLDDAQIRDHALTLLLAGHETTANTLAFALHLIGQDRRLEQRVNDEVDRVLAGRRPQAEDLDQLPICRGVFSESLRLFPPSWAMARHVIAEHRVDGHTIPPGDVVVVPQWVVHRDQRWWPDPLRCDPDRWTPAVRGDRPRWSYFPFGGGVRRCLGEGFAAAEGVLALAVIAQRWTLRPIPQRPLELEPLITLRPRGGLWMQPADRWW